MENLSYTYLDDKIVDISNFSIIGHAMSQYAVKCSPTLSMIEISNQMREKMRQLRRVSIDKKMEKGRLSYIDEEEVIYITEKNKVITTYYVNRIFKAKPRVLNTRRGHKYL